MQRVKIRLTGLHLAYIVLFIPLLAQIAFGILRGVETVIVALGAMFIAFDTLILQRWTSPQNAQIVSVGE